VVFDVEKNHQLTSPDVPTYSRYAVQPPRAAPYGTRISTTMDHYKWWNADPSPPFCEMPTFSNYLLYPGRGRHFQTTTQAFFKGTPGSRPPMTIPRDESTDLLGLITSRGHSSIKLIAIYCLIHSISIALLRHLLEYLMRFSHCQEWPHLNSLVIQFQGSVSYIMWNGCLVDRNTIL